MSSFRKRNVQKPIPGTRTSPQTGQVITSSGNPSLNAILGGGLPVGSICLIEEDKYAIHSKVLAKYFMAEGVVSEQRVFMASRDDNAEQFINKLPKAVNEEELLKEQGGVSGASEGSGGGGGVTVTAPGSPNGAALRGHAPPITAQTFNKSHDYSGDGAGDCIDNSRNGLRIAWRYNDLPIVNSEQSNTKIGHHFNLLQQMDESVLEMAYIDHWQTFDIRDYTTDYMRSTVSEKIQLKKRIKESEAAEDSTEADYEMREEQTDVEKESKPSKVFDNPAYFSLLDDIIDRLNDDEFNYVSGASVNNCNNTQKCLYRICITSLGSALWYNENFSQDLLKFLTILRGAIGKSLAVCLITMPMHLIEKYDANLVHKIRNLVDFSIGLTSLGPNYKSKGVFQLHKISAINTLNAFMPDTSDYIYKLMRKKFVIEKLHLPPELPEASNNDKGDDDSDSASDAISCASNTKTNLSNSF